MYGLKFVRIFIYKLYLYIYECEDFYLWVGVVYLVL